MINIDYVNDDNNIIIIDEELYNYLNDVTTPDLRNILVNIYGLFNVMNFKDYAEEYDSIMNIDPVNISDDEKVDNLVELAKVYSLKKIKGFGLIKNPDLDPEEYKLGTLYNVLLALYNLQYLDISSAYAISGILEDEIADNIDKMFAILVVLNPNLSYSEFNNGWNDVAEQFFIVLKKNVDNIIINDSDILNNEIDEDNNIIELVNTFLDIGFPNLPDILINEISYPGYIIGLKNNPTTTLNTIRYKLALIIEKLKSSVLTPNIKIEIEYTMLDVIITLLVLGYEDNEMTLFIYERIDELDTDKSVLNNFNNMYRYMLNDVIPEIQPYILNMIHKEENSDGE